MCALIAEILMLVGGLYALIAGKIKLTGGMYLEGWRARIAGLFLVAPLPLGFLAGLVLGVLIGIGVFPQEAFGFAVIIEFVLILGGLGGAVIFALLTKPKPPLASLVGPETIGGGEGNLDKKPEI